MNEQVLQLPELHLHGRHVRAEYTEGAWGGSTEEERAGGNQIGTFKRFKKTERASNHLQALGWIKATYENAIEYSGMKQQLEGMIMVGAFFGLMIGGGMLVAFTWMLLDFSDWWFGYLLFIPALLAASVFTAWITLMPLRRVWRTPRDLPVIFDRRHRKVYRMVQDVQPGLKGLFKPWPVKACEYEWDLVDAEHDIQLMASTATAMRLHRLVFVVRKSANDPTIIDHFEIGNAMTQSEELIAPMWEHIRRFMEENGPYLPHPSEPLDSREEDKPTWWQACGRAGPFGSRYLWWWKEHPMLTLFLYHGLALVGIGMTIVPFILHDTLGGIFFLMATWIVLSMNWGQGTGIWLQAHTSRLFDWPEAVRSAIGPALRRGVGW